MVAMSLQVVHILHIANTGMTRVAANRTIDRMPPHIRSEIRRYRRDRDIHASLLGNMLLRYGLVTHFNCKHDVLAKIRRTSSGRPYLPGSGIAFSIAHSGEFISCALSVEEVGLDVEAIRPVDIQALACDLPGVELSAGTSSLTNFFQYWTSREAILKATGHGLHVPISQVSVHPSGDFGTVQGTRWYLDRVHPAPNYYGSLATVRPAIQRVDRVPFTSLLLADQRFENGLEHASL